MLGRCLFVVSSSSRWLLLFFAVIALFFHSANSVENATGPGQFCANQKTKLPKGIKLIKDHQLSVDPFQMDANENVSLVAMTPEVNKQKFTIKVDYNRTELRALIERNNLSMHLNESCREFSEKSLDLGKHKCQFDKENKNCDKAGNICNTTFDVVCHYNTTQIAGIDGFQSYLVTLLKHPSFDSQPCKWIATFDNIHVLANNNKSDELPLAKCLNTALNSSTTRIQPSTSVVPVTSGSTPAPSTTLGGCLLTWLFILLLALMGIQIILVVALVIAILMTRSRHKRKQSQLLTDEEKDPQEAPIAKGPLQTETSKGTDEKTQTGLSEKVMPPTPVSQSSTDPKLPPSEKGTGEVSGPVGIPDSLKTLPATVNQDGGDGSAPVGQTPKETMGEKDTQQKDEKKAGSGTSIGPFPSETLSSSERERPGGAKKAEDSGSKKKEDGDGGSKKAEDGSSKKKDPTYERFESLSLSFRSEKKSQMPTVADEKSKSVANETKSQMPTVADDQSKSQVPTTDEESKSTADKSSNMKTTPGSDYEVLPTL